MDIFQGESDQVVDNEFLGTLRIEGELAGRKIDFALSEECLPCRSPSTTSAKGPSLVQLATRDTPPRSQAALAQDDERRRGKSTKASAREGERSGASSLVAGGHGAHLGWPFSARFHGGFGPLAQPARPSFSTTPGVVASRRTPDPQSGFGPLAQPARPLFSLVAPQPSARRTPISSLVCARSPLRRTLQSVQGVRLRQREGGDHRFECGPVLPHT